MSNTIKILFFLGVFFLRCSCVLANPLQEFDAAKMEYEHTGASGAETSRVAYVSKLADILCGLIQDHMRKGANPPSGFFDILDAELNGHPAPEDSDSEHFYQLRIGKWESPRHDYLYRRDGTWCMLPSEPRVTSGRWYIRGNHYFDGAVIERSLHKYTIILLTKDKFVFSEGPQVYCEWRPGGAVGR